MTTSATFNPLRLSVLPKLFTMIRLPPDKPTPTFVNQSPWYCATRTPNEHSIICLDELVPRELSCERGFRLLKVEGPLPFTAVGILADLSRALADARIPILAVSTYDTDYLLVREEHLKNAIAALRTAGYVVNGV